MWMKAIFLIALLSIDTEDPGEVKGKKKDKPSPPHQVKIDSSIRGEFNYEVSISLTNGGLMYGVVLQGNLYEKLSKRDFARTDSWKSPGAGLRLWYVNDQKGYVFIPYKDILEVSRVKLLTEEEMKRIFERIAKKEEETRKAREKAAEELEKKKAEEEEQAKEEGLKKKEEEGAKADAMKKIIDERLSLFNKFHPDKGWTPEKRKYIKWRGPVIGTFPNKEEQEFLDHYDDWFVVYKEWKEEKDREKEEARKKSEEEAKKKEGTEEGEGKGEKGKGKGEGEKEAGEKEESSGEEGK